MGGWEWAILVLIALLLFGGSRLSGIGRNVGQAVRGFAEEASALKTGEPDSAQTVTQTDTASDVDEQDDIVDAELVDPHGDPQSDPADQPTDPADRPGEA